MAQNQAYEKYSGLIAEMQAVFEQLLLKKKVLAETEIRMRAAFRSMQENLISFENNLAFVSDEAQIHKYEKNFSEAFGNDLQRLAGITANVLNSSASEEEKDVILGFTQIFLDSSEVLSSTIQGGEKINLMSADARMTLSEAQPTRAQILKWYHTLEATLKTAGIDINNPAHLLRVKIALTKEDADSPGEFYPEQGIIRYAFMKRVIDPATGLKSDYANPFAGVDIDIQKKVKKLQKDSIKAVENMKAARSKLEEELGKEKRDHFKILELEKELDTLRMEAVRAEVEITDYKNDAYKDLDKWSLTNSKNYDPETDFDDIRELYLQAREGKLFINDLDLDMSHRRQILVLSDGTSVIGPDNMELTSEGAKVEDIGANWQTQQLYVAGMRTEGIKAKYPDLPETWSVHKIKRERGLGKRPEILPEAPAPGFGSWLKKFFSFGNNTKDYDTYKAYKDSLTAAENYDLEVQKITEEVREHNKETLKICRAIINEERGRDYPAGTVNPAKMLEAQGVIHINDTNYIRNMTPEDFKKEKFMDDRAALMQSVRINEVMLEAAENAGSYDAKGIRNPNISRFYQLKKKFEDKNLKKEFVKVEKTLKNAKLAGHPDAQKQSIPQAKPDRVQPHPVQPDRVQPHPVQPHPVVQDQNLIR